MCRFAAGSETWSPVASYVLLIGQRMSDTQTGLRGVPRALATELLRLPAAGYEFELDMLVLAKHLAVSVREVPIATVYLDGTLLPISIPSAIR